MENRPGYEDTGEGKGGGKGSRKGGGGGGGAATLPCVMKFLTPEVLASAIIGKGGTVIAAMRTSCQAKMGLTDHGDFFPTTDCRVLTVQANEQRQLAEAARQIVSKVVELSKGSTPECVMGSEGDLKLRTVMPRAAVGGLIGKSGAAIKALRESSGAKISIGDAVPSQENSQKWGEQVVTIAGNGQAIEAVLEEVNTQIQLHNGEAWFPSWASTTSSSSAGGGGSLPVQMLRGNMHAPGIDVMMRTAGTLPSYVMEDSRGFALSCVVPKSLVGGLIGRGGAGTKEVQTMTNTKIGIRDIPGDDENRSMNIAGPLASTCAAYMLMMKRYLDAEASAA